MRWLAAVISIALLTACARFHDRPLSPAATASAFESRSLTNAGLESFLESNNVAGPWPRADWGLSSLTLAAFYYQPDLAVARAQWAGAQAARKTAGERPNPSVTVTPGYDSQIPDSPSPWLVPVTFDLPIETAGKRGYRMAEARHLEEAARWRMVGALWEARGRVREGLVDLDAAEQGRALFDEQAAAQSNVVRLLSGQVDAGAASGFDLTQARVALDAALLSRGEAERQCAAARAELAVAVGVPAPALEGVSISYAALESFSGELTAPEVRARALRGRSDVRAALAEYAASQSALQLAVAGQYPDVHLGPGYSWNSGSAGDNEWQLGLTVELPVLNQNQGAIAEAAAKRQEAAARFVAAQAKAIGEIDGALAGYRAAARQSETAAALLKSLQARLDSVRAMARSGNADALAVANAQAEFVAGAQSRLDAVVKAQQALGELEAAVESPLTLPDSALQNAQNVQTHPIPNEP